MSRVVLNRRRTAAVLAGLAVVLSLTGFAPAAQAANAAPARGCVPNGKVLPNTTHDVATQKIGDVDLDGHPDTLFHYSDPDTWGIKTHTGAVMVVRNVPLRAAKYQHAWALQLEADPAVMVIDDDHTALPYFLVTTSTGCHFRAPSNTSGHQYAFNIDGSGTSKYGTGVGCLGSDKGGYNLYGRKTVALSNGRVRIEDTLVGTSDGKVLKNYGTHTNGKTYDKNSETAARASISFCSKALTLPVSNGGH